LFNSFAHLAHSLFLPPLVEFFTSFTTYVNYSIGFEFKRYHSIYLQLIQILLNPSFFLDPNTVKPVNKKHKDMMARTTKAKNKVLSTMTSSQLSKTFEVFTNEVKYCPNSEVIDG